MKKHSHSSAFTLIELLVVIGIVIVIAALTVTGITRVRQYAQKMTCTKNLKSLHAISLMYFEDYNALPTEDLIIKINKSGEKDIRCPAKRKTDQNGDLIANYETIELINFTNQFMDLTSGGYNPALFSDVDLRKLALEAKSPQIYEKIIAPHKELSFVILTSGQFRQFTIAEAVDLFNSATVTTTTSSAKSFSISKMETKTFGFFPAQYFDNFTKGKIELAGNNDLLRFETVTGILEAKSDNYE